MTHGGPRLVRICVLHGYDMCTYVGAQGARIGENAEGSTSIVHYKYTWVIRAVFTGLSIS